MSEQSLPPTHSTFSDREASESFPPTSSSSEASDVSAKVEDLSVEELERRLEQRRREILRKFGVAATEEALPELIESADASGAETAHSDDLPGVDEIIRQKRRPEVGGDIQWRVTSVDEDEAGIRRVKLKEITHRPNPRRTSIGLGDLGVDPTEEGKAWSWIPQNLD